MLEVTVYIIILIAIILLFGSALYAGLRASPWLPIFKRDVKRIIELAAIKKGDKVYDLGSGDGRVLIALANNSEAELLVGYEVSLIPYIISKIRIWFLRLGSRVEIRFGDFLRRDLGSADVIFCFLTPKAMKKLEPKFSQELKPGTRIVSYSFSLPNWSTDVVSKPAKDSMPIFKYVVD